jgi:2-oxoglutarate ferredoxin oxidoreductase subunit alpha
VDSYYNIPSLDFSSFKIQRQVIKTQKDYKRFAQHDEGISPRGIPGYGEGLVGVDSDEHDEEAHITEDQETRIKMVDKRLSKWALIEKEAIPPSILGPKDFRTLLIGWGSTYHLIEEAFEIIGREDLAFMHFSQVFPLHQQTKSFIDQADRVIIIENNAMSQLGRMIKLQTGVDIDLKILKYSGLPFSVEEIAANVRDKLGE